jgi:KDO2-lipid IV(A) lauroyltransferase
VSAAHALEAALVRALGAGARALPWRASLGAGAALGDAARRIGIRRRVAEDNLARAFPGRAPAERAAILRAHYRELGRIALEYPRLAELVRAPRGEVVAEVRGAEHLERARAGGRGAVLLSGHFGNVELMGAALGRLHPVDFLVRPLSNPGVEAWIAAQRARAGVGSVSADTGTRAAYRALRDNRWVAMLADQDARRHGVFVPFLGRPASTALGPARIALATGAAIIMGFCWRGADGRHTIEVDPALDPGDPRDPRAAERLTALHVARLEQRVRERPECWFWLHRRWKTAPPAAPPS